MHTVLGPAGVGVSDLRAVFQAATKTLLMNQQSGDIKGQRVTWQGIRILVALRAVDSASMMRKHGRGTESYGMVWKGLILGQDYRTRTCGR